jgi:hypothetical protein
MKQGENGMTNETAPAELLTHEEAEAVYNALRHPLGITQFTGHSITLIREAVDGVLSARIPLYTQPQSQRIAELEAALRPLAAYSISSIGMDLNGYVVKIAMGDQQPTFADFERARRALSPPQDKGGGCDAEVRNADM